MLHFPLLSDAYAAALFGAAAPRTGPTPHDGCAEPYGTVPPEPLPEPGDEEEDADAAPDDRDDIETARTRPLRLDQIHL